VGPSFNRGEFYAEWGGKRVCIVPGGDTNQGTHLTNRSIATKDKPTVASVRTGRKMLLSARITECAVKKRKKNDKKPPEEKRKKVLSNPAESTNDTTLGGVRKNTQSSQGRGKWRRSRGYYQEWRNLRRQ